MTWFRTLRPNHRLFVALGSVGVASTAATKYILNSATADPSLVLGAEEKIRQFQKLPTRRELVESLKRGQRLDRREVEGLNRVDVEKDGKDEFDLLIIGGGATGTGCALDAASRGLKVALVERDDFASGT